MADKNLEALEALIVKIVKKLLKKELRKLNQHSLPIVTTEVNQQLDNFLETFATPTETSFSAQILNDVDTSSLMNLSTKEDVELERKLRELKFKQELRKDWILFILKDVIVYAATIIFIFILSGFYLFTLIQKS
ncbi:hypothetical protein [Sphaerospermopsis torques-reginae]|jgi:hypothetical protein|uniref:Uncharacterized protein n=1 Tax=Sphaerospermopsis torques-reginae ITEP-024 TaxID=984208 RepID=A0ABX8X453_9CYAN|nr:hypothetical protein [Sphaerospermopsis torques-reginae]QYX33489.1 hypothetical protein K2F26_09340 [Sphaerospermopsis torques-reginae ITEP-024]